MKEWLQGQVKKEQRLKELEAKAKALEGQEVRPRCEAGCRTAPQLRCQLRRCQLWRSSHAPGAKLCSVRQRCTAAETPCTALIPSAAHPLALLLQGQAVADASAVAALQVEIDRLQGELAARAAEVDQAKQSMKAAQTRAIETGEWGVACWPASCPLVGDC